MIRFLALLSQKLFKILSTGTYHRFQQALQDPLAAQNAVLNRIVSDLQQTTYGKRFSLPKNATYEAFCQHIPIVEYETISPWIAQTKITNTVLTKNPIQFYETTSGSQGAKKNIPYNQDLRQNFAHCFKIWGYDCLQHKFALSSMQTFMSISPLVSHEGKSNAILEDSDYVTGALQWLLRPFILRQPHIQKLKDPADFRFILALTLLAHEKLEVISIWSPSYLLILLSIIEERFEEMLGFLARQRFDYQGVEIVLPKISKRRLAHLQAQSKNLLFSSLWPNLQMISCWRAASSERGANILQQYFPKVFIQGKGLLATEGPMTLPIIAAKGYVPLVNELFFEFIDSQQRIYRLHELQVGHEYEIVISQLAGLYRYRIGDTVRVTHFYQNTPCLEFMGRREKISDLVGEKLNERFVEKIFHQAPFSNSICQCLIPLMRETGQGQYYLLTDNKALAGCELHLDQLLSEAFHYHNARNMSQLLRPIIICHPNLSTILTQCFERNGIKMGDQKATTLITSSIIATQLLHTFVQNTA